jgi:hypothetical protein
VTQRQIVGKVIIPLTAFNALVRSGCDNESSTTHKGIRKMLSDRRIQALCEEFGFDELTAWRHLRDQAILSRRVDNQERERRFSKW